MHSDILHFVTPLEILTIGTLQTNLYPPWKIIIGTLQTTCTPLENYYWNPANYLYPPWKITCKLIYLTDILNTHMYLCVLLDDRVWGGAEEEVEIENSSDGSVGDGWVGTQFNL